MKTEEKNSLSLFRTISGILPLMGLKEQPTEKEHQLSAISSIIEASNDAIVTANLKGVVTSQNKGAEKMSGYTAEEVIGKPLKDVAKLFVLEDRMTEFKLNFEKLKQGGKIENFETRRKRKDGSIMDLSTTVVPIKDELNHVRGIAFLARDITEHKNALRLKDQFISTASHELKTPLTAIKTAFEILKSKENTIGSEKKEFLTEAITRNIHRLDNLISELLNYSKMKNPQNQVVIQKIIIKDLLNEIIKCFFKEQHKIEVLIHKDVLNLSADYDKLIQVLLNLINNAIHYAKTKIKLEVIQDIHAMTFSVTDDGCGIEKEDLSLLFHPFVQVRSGEKGLHGTGLGLAICKEIVNLHYGNIWAESEPNKATTFYFKIPRNLK